MLRAALARLYGSLFGSDADAGATAEDGEAESSDPAAFSLLDRSVNEAHGQAGDAGQRAIRQVEATADQLEAMDDERGPPGNQ